MSILGLLAAPIALLAIQTACSSVWVQQVLSDGIDVDLVGETSLTVTVEPS